MAQSRHAQCADECLLLGAKRTLTNRCSPTSSSNLARAGQAERVEVCLGPALKTLPLLAAEASGPFDLIFIDADKESTAEYDPARLISNQPTSVAGTP
jgi:O-methyltransferase